MRRPDSCAVCLLRSGNGCTACSGFTSTDWQSRPQWCPLDGCAYPGCSREHARHAHHYLRLQGKLDPYFKPDEPSDVPMPVKFDPPKGVPFT